MRKVLIIALGLASLGAIASVQPAAAEVYNDGGCAKLAYGTNTNCTVDHSGHRVCVSNTQNVNNSYNHCVAAKAAAIGQSKALTTAKPGPDIQQGKNTHAN